MKRIIFEANGHVPTIPASDVNEYTRILLVNGSGDLGIIIYHSKDEKNLYGTFETIFSENRDKYRYWETSWRALLDLVKDKFTIYYI